MHTANCRSMMMNKMCMDTMMRGSMMRLVFFMHVLLAVILLVNPWNWDDRMRRPAH